MEFSEFLIFVVFSSCIVCGVYSAKIATAKGRNALAWFVCGFAINLAGILFALLVEPNHEQMVMYGQLKRCPFCTEIINVRAVKCPHCTADLQDTAYSPVTVGSPETTERPESRTAETETTPLPQHRELHEPLRGPEKWTTELKECPFCQRRINANAKVCRYCQEELPDDDPSV